MRSRSANAERSARFSLALSAILSLLGLVPAADAAITATGDVGPSDPTTWTSASTTGYVGNTGIGALAVDSGSGLNSSACYIGNNAGALGEVTVDGSGSAWTNSGGLAVGYSGSGILNVTGGAVVTSGSSYAVNGPLYSNYVGYGPGGTGLITVDGVGSTLTISPLCVGFQASGVVNVTGGGSLVTEGVAIGTWAPGSGVVTVAGIGSTWTDTGGLSLGVAGNGTININGGAAVTTSGGVSMSSAGAVNFGNGGGSLTVGGLLTTGRPGEPAQGTINFGTSGATVTTGSLAASASQLTGTGTINTGGLIADTNLVFDSAASLTQTFTYNGQTGQNITVNLDLASNPSANGLLGAGYAGNGSITIAGGTQVTSGGGAIGYLTGSTGSVTVSGAGSTWADANGELMVGESGSGTLIVTNGAQVTSAGGEIGGTRGSTGVVTVTGAGSTWTAANGDAEINIGDGGSGSLNVTGGATVSSSFAFVGKWAPGVALISGAGSSWSNSGVMSVGYFGTLEITNGATVNDLSGTILVSSAAAGLVTVSGIGSTWINTGYLSVGEPLGSSGSGARLSILDGGVVSSEYGYVGNDGGATVAVTGTGSKWVNGGSLSVGPDFYVYGPPQTTINIAGGGSVTTGSLALGYGSLVSIDVGNGSLLAVGNGSGTLTNNGIVRVVAGAQVAAGGTYSPISAGTWTGTGTYQAIGGTWNASNNQFTVSATQAGTAGTPVAIDLSQTQRVLVTDAASGASIGASFLAATSPTPITFTASLLGGPTLASLAGRFASPSSVLSDWTCSATGYAAGSPAYLSLDIGGGYSSDDIDVWTRNGSTWTPFSASDLTYDGTYANFTVAAFGTYAVTTGVAFLPGDANHDGTVDVNDLTIVLANYGRTTGMSWSTGDFTGDGTVDINDLTIVLTNFGQTIGASMAGLHAVPEPGTLALLAAAALGLLVSAGRRRR
jgi:T5SS/PEP-CTERM-associated repeat protein